MSDLSLLSVEDYLTEDSKIKFPSDDFSFENEKEIAVDRKIKIIKIVFFILCFVLIGELVFYKYIMPSFSSPKVTFSGQNMYSAEEIAMKLVPMNATNWFEFDVEQAVSILSSEDGIEKVIVEKKFPDKISINVIEREPVAVTFFTENGRSYPVEIDRNGVYFTTKDSEKMDASNTPIITGIPVEYMAGGMRIPSTYKPLIDQIVKIRSLPQKYFAAISEICVLPKEYGNYELALIPAQSKVKVLTDRTLNEDALKYMIVVSDVVNQIGSDVSEIDLRYGSVSYRTK